MSTDCDSVSQNTVCCCCCKVEVLSVAECVSAYPNIVTNDRVLCAKGEEVYDDGAQSRSSLLADACQVSERRDLLTTLLCDSG